MIDDMDPGRRRLEVLSDAECRRLLNSTEVGRLIYTDGALPAIAIVNYLVHENTIVIRSLPGGKLSAALRRDVVAFEADAIDHAHGTGWSVVVLGEAQPARDGVEAELLASLPLRSWVSDPRPEAFIRVRMTLISGRRLSGPVQPGQAARGPDPAQHPG